MILRRRKDFLRLAVAHRREFVEVADVQVLPERRFRQSRFYP